MITSTQFLSTLSLRRATRQLNSPSRRLRFLSTLSLRRATALHRKRIRFMLDFYPRSPCGERLSVQPVPIGVDIISIHALLAESDHRRPGNHQQRHHISIHALLAESDFPPADWNFRNRHFYPRSPCGERRGRSRQRRDLLRFLSTLSLRRATLFDLHALP